MWWLWLIAVIICAITIYLISDNVTFNKKKEMVKKRRSNITNMTNTHKIVGVDNPKKHKLLKEEEVNDVSSLVEKLRSVNGFTHSQVVALPVSKNNEQALLNVAMFEYKDVRFAYKAKAVVVGDKDLRHDDLVKILQQGYEVVGYSKKPLNKTTNLDSLVWYTINPYLQRTKDKVLGEDSQFKDWAWDDEAFVRNIFNIKDANNGQLIREQTGNKNIKYTVNIKQGSFQIIQGTKPDNSNISQIAPDFTSLVDYQNVSMALNDGINNVWLINADNTQIKVFSSGNELSKELTLQQLVGDSNEII